jgi:hypothetical protein
VSLWIGLRGDVDDRRPAPRRGPMSCDYVTHRLCMQDFSAASRVPFLLWMPFRRRNRGPASKCVAAGGG